MMALVAIKLIIKIKNACNLLISTIITKTEDVVSRKVSK
jgi:hypothetical protein